MRRVPLALLLCLAGMALVIHVSPGLPHPAILVIFSAMLAAWLLGQLGFALVSEGLAAGSPWLAIGFAVLAVLGFFALHVLASVLPGWHHPGDVIDYRGRPDPPANILGWMIIFSTTGWTAFALYRHFIPAAPLLRLTTAGVSYRAAGLKDLLIPWHEIEEVDGFELTGPTGYPLRRENLTTVLVARRFYEAHILPKRGTFGAPGWDRLFLARGASVQIMLPYEWFCIEPKQMREPVEARWTAFRKASPAAQSDAGLGSKTPLVYGAWSIDGSLWQTLTFLGPLTAIVALLASALHAGGR